MKKIIALLLLVCCMAAVSAGCGYTDALDKVNGTSSVEETTQGDETPSTKDEVNEDTVDYDDNIDGLISYFIDKKYMAESSAKTEMDYSLVGAEIGYKFTVNKSVTIELYEYDTKNLNATAKEIINSVKEVGTFTILDLAPVKAYISNNGKYMMIYSDKSINDKKPDTTSANYALREEIIENFKNFK
ncbi:MAG: hypothetical protein MJ089_05865 [Ruminococcus sp.]|nr:hypothetical protein [Ruminococcus sp.]